MKESVFMDRVILHCDLNNYFASVECLKRPELKDKPVAVCGKKEERHGIVLAKNYIAKSYGVSTGEVIWQALNKCPDLVIIEPHYDEYIKYSKMVYEIYKDYTDEIEFNKLINDTSNLCSAIKKISNELSKFIEDFQKLEADNAASSCL